MSWALVGGAVIGTAGSIYASGEASDASRDAMTGSNAINREQLDYIKEVNQPYQDAGVNALNRITGLKPGEMLDLDPGYQFRKDQGERSIRNSLLAKGKGLSGEQIKASIGFNQGLASEEFGNAYARLFDIASLGAGANRSSINATGGISNNMANSYAANAINQGNIRSNQAQDITGIAAGTVNNWMYGKEQGWW